MRTRIPLQLTRFIGREQELGDITRLLAESRLLTLTGPGGSGKTRLAAAAAAAVADRYADGAVWVDLAAIADESLVAQAVARAAGVVEQPGQSIDEWLADYLAGQQTLLVLDNCEHVRAACRRLVAPLLAETSISILATSREPLSIAGERRFPVPPLALPPPQIQIEDPAGIGQFEAVRLFLERAQRVLPAFALTAENAGAVADICRRLDGLPLAIELAAARVVVLSLAQIAARLDDQFALLVPAKNITLSHHQTLRAAIDWSWDSLSRPERLLLQRLSVFAGGCTFTTAERVCAGEGIERDRLLDLLAALVNKSLLTADTVQRREARYSMLETMRQYGQGQLKAAGGWAPMRDRHLECFLELSEQTEPKLRGDFQRLWLNWVQVENDNIRAALSWSLESGQIEQGLRIAAAVYDFWTIRGYTEEALTWMEQLLARPDASVAPVIRARTLAYATFLAGFRGNKAAQKTYGREAAGLAAALGGEGQSALAWATAGAAYAHGRPGPLPSGGSAAAWALGARAYSARAAGDFAAELATYRQLVRLHREGGERHLLGPALITASFAAWSLGHLEEARAMVDEGLPLLRETANPYWIAMTLNGSGDLARCEGNYARAQAEYAESIALLREIGAARDLASALHNSGYTHLHLGDVGLAYAHFSESLTRQVGLQNLPGVAECLIGYAAMAIVSGLPAAAARLLAAAVSLGGERVATTWAATKMEYDHFLERTRAGLDDQAFKAEQVLGRTLSLEEAVGFARRLPIKTAAQSKQRAPGDLTPRELEVAALVAQAMSNDEIAQKLVLSKRTVEKHVSNIRARLGFTQRAQIVRWWIGSRLAQEEGHGAEGKNN